MMEILTSGLLFAQRALETQYPTIEGIRPETTAIGLPEYVKYIFNFSVGLAGLIAFIALIYGGIRYLTSAGSPTAQKDAKGSIFAAFLGLMVLLSSYLILTTINPQLIVLKLPEKIIFSAVPITASPTAQPDTLYYTEIPIGGLIEELFSKARLDGLETISKNAEIVGREIPDKAEGINSLVGQCACSLSSPECDGECSGGSCAGDPCPGKEEINQKRAELSDTIRSNGGKGTLQYWLLKIDTAINGSAEEKTVGFKQAYEDLKKAEDLIKNCQGAGPRGGLQSLSGYSDFMESLDRLKETKPTAKFVSDFPFNYLSSDNYYLATFYCTESVEPYLQIVPEDVPVQLEEISAEQTSQQTMYCGDEISIGETIDNAEELAGKILAEAENIKNNISKEITAVQNLIGSSNPDGCVAGSCSTSCGWVEKQCWEASPCPEVLPPDGTPPPETNWWDQFFFKQNISFAAEDCGKFVDCSYCEIPGCSGSSCLDSKPEIGTQVAEIKNDYLQIASSYEQIQNLIEGKESLASLKISNILNALNSAQSALGECYTSKTRYAQLNRGEETTLESLLGCSGLKQSLEIDLFLYDEKGNKIEQCYGPDIAKPDLMDNFFCCFNNVSF